MEAKRTNSTFHYITTTTQQVNFYFSTIAHFYDDNKHTDGDGDDINGSDCCH